MNLCPSNHNLSAASVAGRPESRTALALSLRWTDLCASLCFSSWGFFRDITHLSLHTFYQTSVSVEKKRQQRPSGRAFTTAFTVTAKAFGNSGPGPTETSFCTRRYDKESAKEWRDWSELWVIPILKKIKWKWNKGEEEISPNWQLTAASAEHAVFSCMFQHVCWQEPKMNFYLK